MKFDIIKDAISEATTNAIKQTKPLPTPIRIQQSQRAFHLAGTGKEGKKLQKSLNQLTNYIRKLGEEYLRTYRLYPGRKNVVTLDRNGNRILVNIIDWGGVPNKVQVQKVGSPQKYPIDIINVDNYTYNIGPKTGEVIPKMPTTKYRDQFSAFLKKAFGHPVQQVLGLGGVTPPQNAAGVFKSIGQVVGGQTTRQG